ncbi:MAG: hypothetical protein JW869_00890 [Candidatus Omnitrophica bacterium]|nr:hypothetical protein [Candidatus Omnitrophota bacterium]
MSSNEVYKKEFQKALLIEERARDYYKYYIDRIKDAKLLEKFKEIYADEQRHVQVVKEFIDILSKE